MSTFKLSKSKANTYLTCPRKYFLSYELVIKPLKRPLALVTGLVAHKIIEAYLRGLEEGKPFSLEGAHPALWAPYPQEETDAEPGEYLEAVDTTLRLARLFMERIETRPAMVEHYFELPLINPATGQVAGDILWVGISDHVNARKEGDLVVDIKTRSRKEDPFVARVSLELTGYAYAYRMITEKQEAGVAQVNLIKTKEPDVQTLEDYRDKEDFNEFFRTLIAVTRGIKTRIFHRNPGFHCGYCDYKPVCGGDIEGMVNRFGEEVYEKLLCGEKEK